MKNTRNRKEKAIGRDFEWLKQFATPGPTPGDDRNNDDSQDEEEDEENDPRTIREPGEDSQPAVKEPPHH